MLYDLILYRRDYREDLGCGDYEQHSSYFEEFTDLTHGEVVSKVADFYVSLPKRLYYTDYDDCRAMWFPQDSPCSGALADDIAKHGMIEDRIEEEMTAAKGRAAEAERARIAAEQAARIAAEQAAAKRKAELQEAADRATLYKLARRFGFALVKTGAPT